MPSSVIKGRTRSRDPEAEPCQAPQAKMRQLGTRNAATDVSVVSRPETSF